MTQQEGWKTRFLRETPDSEMMIDLGSIDVSLSCQFYSGICTGLSRCICVSYIKLFALDVWLSSSSEATADSLIFARFFLLELVLYYYFDIAIL